MREVVSRWVYVVSLAASMSVILGAFVPGYAGTGLLALSLALSVSIAMMSRTSSRSMGDVIGDVEAEPALAFVPMPKAVHSIRRVTP
jgi:hypothetical protein